MWPDWVLNPGPLALESDALMIALHGPAIRVIMKGCVHWNHLQQVLNPRPLDQQPVLNLLGYHQGSSCILNKLQPKRQSLLPYCNC